MILRCIDHIYYVSQKNNFLRIAAFDKTTVVRSIKLHGLEIFWESIIITELVFYI